MTLALVKGQLDAQLNKGCSTADKWKIFRDICEAKERLGLRDRALTVLSALLSFYPETELSEVSSLTVFPSNAQLSVRAHGVAEVTLRRHLAALVEAGLIIRRDSPNGKRYVHRNPAGEITDAFGFSLTPLLARAGELALIAQQIAEERLAYKRTKEALTLCRRDVRKLISAAIEEGANGNWASVEDQYLSLVARLPRTPSKAQVEDVLNEMALLREEVTKLLETHISAEKMDGSAVNSDRHIQNSKPESLNEFEPALENRQGGNVEKDNVRPSKPLKSFPLGMVLRACPQIADYGAGGKIENWRDLMAAAVVVRSMLGVSPSSYQSACEAMGPENAATVMACILERTAHIRSAGGYLRHLTRRTEKGEFSLGPMLMALLQNASKGP